MMTVRNDMEKRSTSAVAVNLLDVAAALVCLAILAAGFYWVWRSENRDTEDNAFAARLERRELAQKAKSLIPFVDQLEAMRLLLSSLKPGTSEYLKVQNKLTEAQNLLALQLPDLVACRDSEGNCVIINTADAKLQLKLLIDSASLP